MAMNLLESLRSYLPSNLVDKASTDLNESSSNVNKALTAAVPAVLAGFIQRSESGDAQGLLNDAKEAANSGVLTNPQGFFGNNAGGFLSGGLDRILGMFGGAGSTIVSAISSFAGIKSGSAQSLITMLAPLGLGVLGKHAEENKLSAQGLGSFLSSQKSTVMNALPSGFSLGSLGNLGSGVKANFDRVSDKGNAARGYVEDRARGSNAWLWWLLLGIAAIAILWYFLGKGCNKAETTTVTDDTTTTMPVTPMDSGMTTSVTTGQESVKVRLADGTEIDAYRGGVEDQLVNCLNDAGCTAGKDKWFDFDNVNFEVGSTKLTPGSQQQINNISAILKAYSKAKIKIGGYTDKTGDAATNKRLSQQRADAVLNAIKAAGANASQLIGAEGYGSEFAKVDASASDEERKQDRRIAVQLSEK